MRRCLIVLGMMLFCGASYAAIGNNLVVQAEKYLNSITGLDGIFVQNANGNKQQGR